VTVAEAQETTGRRASLGWRAAAALVQRREASILVVALVMIVVFSLINENFYNVDSVGTMFEFGARLMLIAAAEVFLLICAEIDLSVGMVYALVPFVLSYGTDDWGLPVGLAMVLALLVAGAVGLTNGVVTVLVGVPSFITTLGMIFLINGITLTTSNAFPRDTPRDGSTWDHVFGGYSTNLWDWLPIRSNFLWGLFAVVVLQFVLSRTRWGLHTIATGGNLVGAAESGVNVRMVKIVAFVMCSLIGGFSGILESNRIGTIEPLQGGTDVMFYAVAGAVIGGTSLMGGAGTVAGAFLGVVVIVIINTFFVLQGISANKFNIVIGATILVAMVINVYVQRLKTLGRLAR
jgi:simple sugar transport system permease protein